MLHGPWCGSLPPRRCVDLVEGGIALLRRLGLGWVPLARLLAHPVPLNLLELVPHLAQEARNHIDLLVLVLKLLLGGIVAARGGLEGPGWFDTFALRVVGITAGGLERWASPSASSAPPAMPPNDTDQARIHDRDSRAVTIVHCAYSWCSGLSMCVSWLFFPKPSKSWPSAGTV